jgi:hypothetical protein
VSGEWNIEKFYQDFFIYTLSAVRGAVHFSSIYSSLHPLSRIEAYEEGELLNYTLQSVDWPF